MLSIEQLRVVYRTGTRETEALRCVDLRMAPGEWIGLYGRSGSGKSTLARVLLRLLPESTEVSATRLEFSGTPLISLTGEALRKMRGGRISLLPQEPALALNPFLTAEQQLYDAICAHRSMDIKEAQLRARQLLDRLMGEDGSRIWKGYPHQMSSGQRQRLGLGLALAGGCQLLIADEPTASVDSVTRFEILTVLRTIRAEQNLAMLLISHDRALLRAATDRVVELRDGAITK